MKTTHQTNDIILRIRRYFRCFWMASTGRNPYTEDNGELWKAIGELETLKDNYCVALTRWSESIRKVSELSQSNAHLMAQVNDLRNVVEKLLERIRDKERIINERQKSTMYNKVGRKIKVIKVIKVRKIRQRKYNPK